MAVRLASNWKVKPFFQDKVVRWQGKTSCEGRGRGLNFGRARVGGGRARAVYGQRFLNQVDAAFAWKSRERGTDQSTPPPPIKAGYPAVTQVWKKVLECRTVCARENFQNVSYNSFGKQISLGLITHTQNIHKKLQPSSWHLTHKVKRPTPLEAHLGLPTVTPRRPKCGILSAKPSGSSALLSSTRVPSHLIMDVATT